MFYETIINGIPLMRSTAISAVHAFTTRYGGVSGGVYASLNLGENRGDDKGKVRENYRRLCSALDIPQGSMVFTRQVHGSDVRVATGGDAHELFSDIPYEADALVTNMRRLALIIFTADCVPVLLHDPVRGVIGAAHCGWRSAAGDILGKTLSAMEGLGAKPCNVRAAIGPSIGACCFETGPEVPEALSNLPGVDGDISRAIQGKPGKSLVNLRLSQKMRLLSAGLPPDNISVSDECTMCESAKYWSHRVTGAARGSQASIIMLT